MVEARFYPHLNDMLLTALAPRSKRPATSMRR
jgi:hypothetical protein